MTLVKTKKTVSAQKRKLSAEHHRKSQHYIKTYWPYLPMILILGGAYAISSHLPNSLFTTANPGSYSSRAGALVGSNSQWIVYLLYILLGALIIWYLSRNYKKIKKLALSSEQVLARHYSLDILLALLIGGLYIVLR